MGFWDTVTLNITYTKLNTKLAYTKHFLLINEIFGLAGHPETGPQFNFIIQNVLYITFCLKLGFVFVG